MVNRNRFFAAVKQPLFGASFDPIQVINIDSILDEYESRQWKDLRWLAYIFGTVYHETGLFINKKLVRTMAPVEEMGKGKGRRYGAMLKFSGKPYLHPDKIYYGRGHTQNTWYEIYEALTNAAINAGKPWDFLNNPELLLQIEPSIWATFHAMSTGLYTGRKLSQYFGKDIQNWTGARTIINGTDKASEIASFSLQFHSALKTAS